MTANEYLALASAIDTALDALTDAEIDRMLKAEYAATREQMAVSA